MCKVFDFFFILFSDKGNSPTKVKITREIIIKDNI